MSLESVSGGRNSSGDDEPPADESQFQQVMEHPKAGYEPTRTYFAVLSVWMGCGYLFFFDPNELFLFARVKLASLSKVRYSDACSHPTGETDKCMCSTLSSEKNVCCVFNMPLHSLGRLLGE